MVIRGKVQTKRQRNMAGRVRFELTIRQRRILDFESSAFNHSATYPARGYFNRYFGLCSPRCCFLMLLSKNTTMQRSTIVLRVRLVIGLSFSFFALFIFILVITLRY